MTGNAQPDTGVADNTHSAEVIEAHGLTLEEYAAIERALNHAPSLTELGIYSVMWSEHCSYKSSRLHLGKFPTEGDQVICGPGENAGIVAIGDNQAAIFKMESHNHPSFIEPYQGAATGVGGIMRDVFTMGARPVANLNALRFGAPDHPKTRHLVSGVVAGIGGYGNCVGVPTVGGEVNFDGAYNGNILVNAMCVGIADQDRIFYAAASGAGNPVVYVGAKTGRDGIHGATMASAEFDDKTEAKRPTVQVGDPFTEKLLLEACLELMAEDAIIGIQDMGAAGLTSSSVEMAAKGGVGIRLDLDQVPQRETNMTAYEMMLSESQERMLMVLKPGREDRARKIFEKWQLDFAVIGKTTETGHLEVWHDGVLEADIPLGNLADDAPRLDRPWLEPETPAALAPDDTPAPASASQALRALMGSPDLCSKRWVWEQYDHMVMADTVARPGGDAALVRVHGTSKALAITCDVTPRYVAANPRAGGKQAVAEAWRNLTAVGADPLAITDCLNFGSPERPEIMGQFVGAVEGMSEACAQLGFPVVSGNVSFYNETDGRAILPTPAVGGVGLVPDLEHSADLALKNPGDHLILIGGEHGALGQSLYLRELHGMREGDAPPVDLDAEKRNGDFVRALIRNARVNAVHDCADGGLYVAIAEMALAGNLGADITLGDSGLPPHAILFGEDQARYVLAAAPGLAETILKDAQDAQLPARHLGMVQQDTTRMQTLTVGGQDPISLNELRNPHENWLEEYMAGA